MWYLVKTMNDKYSIRYHRGEGDKPYRSLRNSTGEMWVFSISEFTKSELNSSVACNLRYIRKVFGDITLIPLPLVTDPDAAIEVFHSTYPELFL